jgi:bifunctional non-homologous end joining protein LigD
MPRFVIQRHEARTLHYDFRLERDGVFKSWAVPKGVPEEPGMRRLALAVEDHSLAFGDFEGEIPAGQYGAGTVEIWDRGTYELHEWGDDRIAFTLQGGRLQGRYRMIRFRRKGEREWLLWREDG